MAVVLDILGTEGFSTGVTPRTYTGLTTSAVVANGAITVAVVTDTHVSGTSATWDGVAMTLLASINTTGANGRVEIYGLAPITGHTGNKTFSFAWTSGGSASAAICGVSWSGVNQTGGTVSFPNATTTTGDATVNGNTSVTVNSAVGNMVVAAHVTDSQSFFTTNNNTRIFLDNSNFPSTASAVANYASGAASVAMTGGFVGTTGTTTFASAGTDILAAASATVAMGGAIHDAGTTFTQTITYKYIAQPVAFTTPLVSGWNAPLSEPVRAKQGLNTALQQSYATEYFPDAAPNANAGLWFAPLSEPVRIKQRLIALDQSYVPLVTTEVVTVDKWFDAFSEPVRVKSRFSATQQTYTSGYAAFEVVTVDKWFDQLSEPVRTRPALRAALQPTATQDAKLFPDPANFLEGWFAPFSDPVRQLQGLKAGQQSFYANSWVLETVTVDKWFDALSEPVRVKPGLRAALQLVSTQDTVFIPNPSQYMEGWFGGLAEPIRQKLGLSAALQSTYTAGYPEIISVDKWYEALSEPKRFKPALHVSLQQTLTQDTVFIPSPSRYMEGWYGWLAEPVRQKAGLTAAQQPTTVSITTPEVVTVDKWFTPLTEPVRQKIGLSANQQQTLAYAVSFTTEVVTVDKWFVSYSEPVRFKRGQQPELQQVSSQDPRYIPNPANFIEGWFKSYAEPIRVPARLVTAAQQAFFYGTITPEIRFDYYAWLTEPVRQKKGLGTHLQRAFTQDPKLFPNPARFLEGWYNWFSEPVRKLPQLNVALQQSWTGPNRKPVLATITVTMAATEINNDVPLFAVRVLPYNPPATAVVSLTEIGHGASLTSIVEQGDDGSGTSVVES